MITCKFENGNKASLRHAVTHAIVEREGKILLIKRAEDLSTEPDKWALPGGFLDRDENAEQGVLRELLEETGWKGEVVDLFRINSSPARPHELHRQNVALEFLIKPLKEVAMPDKESSKVEWIGIENIRLDDLAFDFKDTLKLYFRYKRDEISIPIIE